MRGAGLSLVLAIAALLCLPGEGRCAVTYGIQVQHQWNETKSTATSSTTQDRFSFDFNANTRPSSKLTLAGIFRFDVLLNKTTPGSQSTEIQPNIDLRAASTDVQLGVGYRVMLHNESVISGASTSTLSSDSREAYVDTAMHPGKLPDIRLRYGLRSQKQQSNGVATGDITTDELRASLNYRIGLLTLYLDYLNQANKDKLGGTVTDQTQLSGQASASTNIGTKANLSLRENYIFSQGSSNGATSSRRYTSASEARLNVNPFRGGNINTSYLYNVSGDQLTNQGGSTDKTWFTSMNYSFPRSVRVYGSYNMRQADSAGVPSSNSTTIAGLNFGHGIGKIGMSARYEKRYNSSSTGSGPTQVNTSDSQDNFDWLTSAYISSYMNLGLSGSFISSTTRGQTTKNTRYRLRANLGPIKNIAMGPYIDYATTTPATGSPTTTTDLIVPITYRMSLFRRLDFSMMDNYAWHKSQTGTVISTSTSNGLSFRLGYSPFRNTRFSGDASFSSSSSNSGPTATTSAYTVIGGWAGSGQSANASFRYQTGSSTISSSNYAVQYGISVRMKKLQANFQARYDFAITNSNPVSTSQSAYLVLSVRK